MCLGDQKFWDSICLLATAPHSLVPEPASELVVWSPRHLVLGSVNIHAKKTSRRKGLRLPRLHDNSHEAVSKINVLGPTGCLGYLLDVLLCFDRMMVKVEELNLNPVPQTDFTTWLNLPESGVCARKRDN